MTDEKRETAERPKITESQAQAARETGHISHEDEARGYIARFLELDYLDDLAAVLQAAEQLTSRKWSVVITAEGAQINALGPSDEEGEGSSSEQQDDEQDDEEIIELDDLADSEPEDELDEDSFSDFEDAFDDEDD